MSFVNGTDIVYYTSMFEIIILLYIHISENVALYIQNRNRLFSSHLYSQPKVVIVIKHPP